MLRKDLTKSPNKEQAHGHRHALKRATEFRFGELTNGLYSEFETKLGFTEEGHFHLNCAANHHNNVYWGDERPEETDESYWEDHTQILLLVY